MKLKHISVGKTKILDINGTGVETAYLKEPTKGPVNITMNGVEGNDVAVHTDAIYAFAAENYEYWAKRLNADAKDWRPGHFAENLTISGLNEDDFSVGDIISVGSQVELSVAGPRVPCFKLSWRMGQPDTFIKEFAISGKGGVYFNVKRTGIVNPGDDIRIIKKAKNGVPINDIADYIFAEKDIKPEELEHILSLEGLSETSALFLRNMLYRILDHERTTKNRWKNWRSFTVDEVREETPLVTSYYLRPEEKTPLAPYRAGQFLTINLTPDEETSLVRVWSLSDYQDEPTRYRISVKREEEGKGGSKYLHDKISVGSTINLKPPLGRFVLDRASFKPILLIAGGIGVTPLLAMAKSHLLRGIKAPPLYFIHCCQNRLLQPFRAELDDLAQQEGVKVLHIYNRPNSSDQISLDYEIEGYLLISHIQEFMEGCHIIHGGKRIDMPWFESDIYVCGPPAFQDKLVEEMTAAGANPDRVYTESFSAGDSENNAILLETAEVVFAQSGKTTLWRAEDNLTLLELAEESGIVPDNACRMGVCQSCAVRLREGTVHYQYSLTHKPEDGSVLLCSALPASSRIVVDL